MNVMERDSAINKADHQQYLNSANLYEQDKIDIEVMLKRALDEDNLEEIMNHLDLFSEHDQVVIISEILSEKRYDLLVDNIQKIPEHDQVVIISEILSEKHYDLLVDNIQKIPEQFRDEIIDKLVDRGSVELLCRVISYGSNEAIERALDCMARSTRECVIEFLSYAPLDISQQLIYRLNEYRSDTVRRAILEMNNNARRCALLSVVLRSVHADYFMQNIRSDQKQFPQCGEWAIHAVLSDNNYQYMGNLLTYGDEQQLNQLADGMFKGDRWGDLLANYDSLPVSSQTKLVGSAEYRNMQEIMQDVPLLDPTDCLNGKICSERVFNILGKRRIEQLIYYKSEAVDVFESLNDAELVKLANWLDWLESTDLYSSNLPRLIHLGVISFVRYQSVMEQLMNEEVILSPELREGLVFALESKTIIAMNSLDDLAQSPCLIHNTYIELIDSDEPLQRHSLEGLFSRASARYVFTVCRDLTDEVLKGLVDEDVLSLGDVDFVKLVRQIYDNPDSQQSRQVLKMLLSDKGTRLGGRMDHIIQKTREHMGRMFKQQLYVPSGEPDESTIYNNTQVDVYKLNGQDFKILQHAVHCFNNEHNQIFQELKKDPSVWNKARGSSTLSTNFVSSNFMRHIAVEIKDDTGVLYGFTDFADDAIIAGNEIDMQTDNEIGTMDPNILRGHPYITPDTLIKNSIQYWKDEPDVKYTYNEEEGKTFMDRAYNEVALWRLSGTNQNRYAGRIQPSYVIAYGKDMTAIDDISLRSATYFQIPIVLIDDEIYKQRR